MTLRRRIAVLAVGAAGVLVVLAAWEAASRLELLDRASFPPTTEVLGQLVDSLQSGGFWRDVGRTLWSAALGLAISVAIALPLGVALGLSSRAFLSSRFLVEMLKPIPVVAILPLALLIFGTTLKMKLLLICFGTLWPLLIQVMYGVRDVDPVLADTARAFRLGYGRRVAYVVLPSAAPFVATGLRLAATAALVLSIVTELVGGAGGLGLAMSQAQDAGNYADVYALVIATGFLGLAVNAAFTRMERVFLHWHAAQRREVAP